MPPASCAVSQAMVFSPGKKTRPPKRVVEMKVLKTGLAAALIGPRAKALGFSTHQPLVPHA